MSGFSKGEIEALNEAQSSSNFNPLNDEFREKIESVDIFYEDCENCDSKEECSSIDQFRREERELKKLHENLKEKGIESDLHPLTSKDHGEIDEVVAEKGGVLPLTALFGLGTPLVTPSHNHFYVEMKDGRRLLYRVVEASGGSGSRNDEKQKFRIYR